MKWIVKLNRRHNDSGNTQEEGVGEEGAVVGARRERGAGSGSVAEVEDRATVVERLPTVRVWSTQIAKWFQGNKHVSTVALKSQLPVATNRIKKETSSASRRVCLCLWLMCPLRQQQQQRQRNAQLMWAYKFTHVCPSFCVSVCVCVYFFGSSIVPILTYPSAAISCRRLCAAEIWRGKEWGRVGCQIRWLHIQKQYSQNYSRARFNQKRCRNVHTHSNTKHTLAMAPASMQQFLLSFDFPIFISIYVLCLAFFLGF